MKDPRPRRQREQAMNRHVEAAQALAKVLDSGEFGCFDEFLYKEKIPGHALRIIAANPRLTAAERLAAMALLRIDPRESDYLSRRAAMDTAQDFHNWPNGFPPKEDSKRG